MENKFAHLPHRAVLEIQGEDKATFLQGLITNDITKVTPTQTIYAALLTPQGRFLYDFFISEKEESYFLETDKERIEALLKKLNLYKLRSEVNLSLRPDIHVFALWGEGTAENLGLLEEKGYTHDLLFIDPRLIDLGARSLGKKDFDDFIEATPGDFALHRYKLGVPEGDQDMIPEKSIPLECGLDELQAISWTKGCYMGQELTARTKYRGLVRKRFFPVKIEGKPSPTGEISLNDKVVGELRSYGRPYGLALLRLEAMEEGKTFTCGSTRIEPYKPLWMNLDTPS
jgi:folate-binding protein YgfZ